MTQSNEDRSYFEIGLDHARAGKYDKAIKYLTLVIDQGLLPEDEEDARSWRSICFGQSGRVQEALVDADWLITRGNGHKYRWRAHLRERIQDHEGAIMDYTSAIERDPERATFEDYLKRGQAYFRCEKYTNAIDDFDMALSLTESPTLVEAIRSWLQRSRDSL